MSARPEPIAHSAPRHGPGREPQPYRDHVVAVAGGADRRVGAMLDYAMSAQSDLREGVKAAATFHDLGKLDPQIQRALRTGRGAKLPVDHVDAGVAHLQAANNTVGAWLVRAHHAPGLPSQPAEVVKPLALRGARDRQADARVHERAITHTDATLPSLLTEHDRACGPGAISRSSLQGMHGVSLRLALSCLVDADHSDSAAYDTGVPEPSPEEGPLEPRWAERLAQLDAFVAAKQAGERSEHRAAFYHACRNSAVVGPIARCEGPVGIGKTTAVTAYLLMQAMRDRLRHLIIVAPYTNIITQVVKELRAALVLPGERAEDIVAEHHHRADFASVDDRDLATLWRAPIIVTTAVQFFETLASNAPGRLRKLHELPGSAVFLDEAHAALPTQLWPQNWRWMKELAERWSCRFVLASGSLARFWTLERIVGVEEALEDIAGATAEDEAMRVRLLKAEHRRVRYEVAGEGMTVDALCSSVQEVPGPRLVILNTVQSAAVVASALRARGGSVHHLSTSLCPRDRDRILQRVQARLEDRGDQNWTLVATSCVEAGVDLSFQAAFRERASASSLIQVGGRVNRHGERDPKHAVVFDFTLLVGAGITKNPQLACSADVLGKLLAAGAVNERDSAELVTEAMRRELRRQVEAIETLSKHEAQHDYPAVAQAGQVIDDDTVLVVVDDDLVRRLESRDGLRAVSTRELLLHSVQMRTEKVVQQGLRQISGRSEVFAWGSLYDPEFLGYMAHVLATLQLTVGNTASP